MRHILSNPRRRRWRACTLPASLLALLVTACESSSPPPPPQPAGPAATAMKPVAAPAAPAPATAPAAQAPARPLGAPTGTFLDRDPQADLRLVTYNVMWNSLFPEFSAEDAAKIARVLFALNPDILALQEIGVHPQDRGSPGAKRWTAEDVRQRMEEIAPLPGGARWHAHQGSDAVIVTRFPLKMTATQTEPPAEREQAIALVDLPDDQFKVDLYVLNNHFKCCDAEKNDPLRQQQADAIAAWVRDARTPGGHIDLPAGTALAVVGDLNIVGSFDPIQTLLDGDIHDEDKYGPDAKPDWDDTSLTDLHPLHNGVGSEDWTWRADQTKFKPGRLDFIIYTDSVMEAVKKFVLNSTVMSDADLEAAGLQKFDTCRDDVGQRYDHLPLVVDFRFTLAAVQEEPTAGE